MCVASIFSACAENPHNDTSDFERIFDIDFYADMQKEADKIEVVFDNGTQERFKFSITDESDIEEIMDIIFADTLIDLGTQLKPPGFNTYISVYQGEKVYSLSVIFITVKGRLYTFSTRNLSDKIFDLATAQGAFKKELTQSVLCGIEEAYTTGLISKDDLKSIAYYFNGENAATGFVPTPKDPESLSEDTIKKIQRTYCDKVSGDKTEAVVDEVNIGGYYGTYNGCVIVEINASCIGGIGGDPICYPEYMIEDVVFYWYTPLHVWKEIGI